MSVMAFGQNESTPMPTEAAVTQTPTPVNTSTSPSLGGLGIIFGAMVLIVLVPIAIFAWYNKETLKIVLEYNQKFASGKGEKPDYLFSWDEIKEKDSVKFIEFLKQEYGIDGVKKENIQKPDYRTIEVSNGNKSLSLKLNDEKTKVNLTIDDRTDEFLVKTENDKLNIYKPKHEKPGDKREPVTTLIKALIPPEPLGMPNGSVRAVIAIIGIGSFAYAVFTFSENRPELVAALITLVSSVTGFYFGARATEEVRKTPSPKTPPSTEP